MKQKKPIFFCYPGCCPLCPELSIFQAAALRAVSHNVSCTALSWGGNRTIFCWDNKKKNGNCRTGKTAYQKRITLYHWDGGTRYYGSHCPNDWSDDDHRRKCLPSK